MLEQKDLQMISEIMERSNAPIIQRLDRIEGDVSVLKTDVSGLKEDVSVLKTDVSGLKEDVSGLKEDVSGLKEDVRDLKMRTSRLEEGQRDIRLTIENELLHRIKIIAEGHYELKRKLDLVLASREEWEDMKVRMNYVEDQVHRLNKLYG